MPVVVVLAAAAAQVEVRCETTLLELDMDYAFLRVGIVGMRACFVVSSVSVLEPPKHMLCNDLAPVNTVVCAFQRLPVRYAHGGCGVHSFVLKV
jgi:hypothetical protein